MPVMGLPIRNRHRKVLRELLAAGPEGLPAQLLFDTKWLLELVDHQLAEPFVDRSRILCDRYRLTWQGLTFARFFNEEIAHEHHREAGSA
jgi:hypothetical protein